MTKPNPWKKEHYECMYSHKNLDDCCKDFQNKFPKITFSSVLTHWNHKTQYRKDYEKLLLSSDKPTQPINAMVCPSCKSTLVSSNGQLKCEKCGYIRIDERAHDTGIHTVILKTKAKTEPIKTEKVISNVIDDESIRLWEYRALRSEQVQLMKEMVETNKKLSSQSEQQTKILSKILESFETAKETQLRRLAEEKEREDRKKNMETAVQQVTA